MSLRTKLVLMLGFLLCLVLPTFAQDSKGVIDALDETGDFSHFVRLVRYAGQENRLNDTDLFFTVFALSDDEVDALLKDVGYDDIDELEDQKLEDSDAIILATLVLYHVAPGAYSQDTFDAMEDAFDGPLSIATAFYGTTLTYEKGVINDSAEVTDSFFAGNAVVYVLDHYLVPSGDVFDGALDVASAELELLEGQEDEGSIADYLEDHDEYSMIREAFDTVGLMDDLDDKGPYTLFIMTDESLENALNNADLDWDDLMDDPDTLGGLLAVHILPTQFSSPALKALDGSFIGAMLPYTVSQITLDRKTLSISGIELTETDIVANNGIIHVIDGLILPPSMVK